MTIARMSILAIFGLATALLTGNSAKASDTYRHIDGLALSIQAQSGELVKEFALHYRHKAGYAHLRADALQMYRTAAHIHTIAHHTHDLHHLRIDLRKADRLLHHLEEVLERTDRSYGGHTHGDTHHVFELMHGLSQNLHHLKRDVAVLDRAAHRGFRGNIHPSQGHGYGHDFRGFNHGAHIHNSHNRGRSGIQLRGRRWSIRIGH